MTAIQKQPLLLQPLSLLMLGLAVVILRSGALQAEESATLSPPQEFPPGELGRVVALGKEIVESTSQHPLSKPYVGNALNCSSCHLDAGTDPQAGTFLGVATAYPAWSPREQRVITLEDHLPKPERLGEYNSARGQ